MESHQLQIASKNGKAIILKGIILDKHEEFGNHVVLMSDRKMDKKLSTLSRVISNAKRPRGVKRMIL